MKKSKKSLIIGVCIVVLLLAAIILAIVISKKTPQNADKPDGETTVQTGLDTTEKSPQQSGGTAENTNGSVSDTQPDDSVSNGTVAPPDDLPSTIVIPSEKDEQTGENLGISFPCKIPEYNITLEKIANHSGMYVENGLNTNNVNVAMMLVKNESGYPIEYMSISVEYANEVLVFDISALPNGERLVVQEKLGKTMPETKPTSCKTLIVRKAEMEMSEETVSVTDNGNNTITVQNLTDKSIPTVRVFYKYYMPDEDMYVGGIAFTVRLTRLPANGKMTIQPSHYTSGSCKIVMVLTYDKEV